MNILVGVLLFVALWLYRKELGLEDVFGEKKAPEKTPEEIAIEKAEAAQNTTKEAIAAALIASNPVLSGAQALYQATQFLLTGKLPESWTRPTQPTWKEPTAPPEYGLTRPPGQTYAEEMAIGLQIGGGSASAPTLSAPLYKEPFNFSLPLEVWERDGRPTKLLWTDIPTELRPGRTESPALAGSAALRWINMYLTELESGSHSVLTYKKSWGQIEAAGAMARVFWVYVTYLYADDKAAGFPIMDRIGRLLALAAPTWGTPTQSSVDTLWKTIAGYFKLGYAGFF